MRYLFPLVLTLPAFADVTVVGPKNGNEANYTPYAVALYDAGESIAQQLPALLDEEVTMPDFTIKPLLNGDEIAKLTGIEAGPRLGEVKRALIEAQIRGEVATKADAEEYVRRGGRPRPPGAA